MNVNVLDSGSHIVLLYIKVDRSDLQIANYEISC